MKPIITLIAAIVILIASSSASFAQLPAQNVKGILLDRISEKPLEGATVLVEGLSIATVTDAQGRFTLEKVPVGRQKISFSYSGYSPVTIPEVLVTSGKEVVLEIALEQNIPSMNEILIRSSKAKKGAASNEYVIGSNRSFNLEEVTRYAGGRNDPSRLVSNFAGVVANNDSRNDIVVRGNSPTGVLWRIEGLPSPSPNHYATLGTTGGPVSALNTNALKTSDFLTGAFPAEFGNATAAVFDINLRTGNPDRHERTLQLNLFSGAEIMLEGPLSKKRNGSSYLVGGRYSFAQIGSSLGLNIGTTATPNYQDWVFNINFAKSNAGRFSVYGMGGFSSIDFIGKDVDTTDFYARKDQDSYSKGNFGVIGLKHTLDIGSRSYLRTGISYSFTKSDFDDYQYPLPFKDYSGRYQITQSRNNTSAIRFSSYFNTKVNASFSWRAGVVAEGNTLDTRVLDREGMNETAPFQLMRDYDDDYLLLQSFAQMRYKFGSRFTLNAGIHTQHLSFNSASAIEPRASLAYQLTPNDQAYLSYGLHSQVQPFPVYLYEAERPDGSIDRSNRDLDFTRAHHFVLGYEKRFAKDWRIKAEAYYQKLFDVPVERTPSGFSILNSGADFTFPEKAGLVNEGKGSNQGVELTIEKFLSKGYYVMLTGSFFDSKYEGSDGIERNTTFNYKNVLNVLAGREWKVGRNDKNAFTIDVKLSSIGGRYQTPVDLAASQAAQKEVLDESRYNTERLDSYFRLDTKFGFRLNSARRKVSHTFYLDLQNITARENIFLQRYNPERGTIGSVNQIGFFPDILYRFSF